MKYIEFYKSVQSGKLSHAYFFAGEEIGLIEDGVSLLLKRLVNDDDRDFNFDVFYGNEISATKVIEIARSYPMMAGHRTLVIRDVHKMPPNDLNAVASYTKKPCETTYLILTQRDKTSRKKAINSLRTNSTFIDCRPLYDNQVVPWINNYVRRLGLKITPDAALYLAAEVGGSVMALRSEIEKIRLFIDEGKAVTIQHVQQVTGSRREFSVFTLQDAFGRRELTAALKIIDHLLQTSNSGFIVSGLARYFNHLYIAQALPLKKDASTLSKMTGVHTFFVDGLQAAARNYPPAALFNALEILHFTDYLAKTRSISKNILLRLMTIAIIKELPPKYLPFHPSMERELFSL